MTAAGIAAGIAADSAPVVSLLGLRLARLDAEGVLDHIFTGLARGQGGWLLTANLDFLRRYRVDPAVRTLYDEADLAVADGMPLVWAARLQGTRLPGRVPGAGLVHLLAQRAAREGRSIYLLGGEPASNHRAAEVLRRQHRGLNLVGASAPWVDAVPLAAQVDDIAGELARCRPDILLAGLGSPKQERLIRLLRARLPRTWMIGVGISFSFIAGDLRRAPPWMQQSGLEWLHRMVQEPDRLLRRYLVEDLPFAGVLLAGAAQRGLQVLVGRQRGQLATPSANANLRAVSTAASRLRSVAIYLPDLSGGGAERVMLELARVFSRRGLAVTFLLHRAAGELVPLVPREVRLVSLDRGRTLAAAPGLARFLRRERPDVMLSNLGHNNIAALWARRLARSNSAVVVCQHSVLRSESASTASWQHGLLPLLYRGFLGWADAVVAVSRGVAEDLAAACRFPRARIDVIHNPVLFSGFDVAAAEAVAHPWLDDASVPLFVAAGRLVPSKDFATLLRALALLGPARRARLLLLGEGPERPALERLVHELGLAGRVELAGFKANPLPYIRRADALVMSSRYEGFGNVLVEALGCGTPVISTDCPHGPAEILAGGRFGPLTPVGDPPALAAAMARTLAAGRPPPEALRARARDFEADRIADQYIDLFCRVTRA